MYCPSCGAWNADDSKFCGKCGCPVQAEAGTPSRFAGGARASRSGLCLIMLMVGIVVILGIVAVGAFVLRDQLGSIWPRATDIVVSATPSATSAPVVPTSPSATPTGATTPRPSPSPAVTAAQTPTLAPTEPPTPTPVPTLPGRAFKLVYRGCIPHAQSLGSVKGQILNNKGSAIVGAKVRIMIDGYDWKSDANPATTNPDGWYEWILQVDQKVKFVELTVDGKSVPFAPGDLEFKATGGCFQRVDFVER